MVGPPSVYLWNSMTTGLYVCGSREVLFDNTKLKENEKVSSASGHLNRFGNAIIGTKANGFKNHLIKSRRWFDLI